VTRLFTLRSYINPCIGSLWDWRMP